MKKTPALIAAFVVTATLGVGMTVVSANALANGSSTITPSPTISNPNTVDPQSLQDQIKQLQDLIAQYQKNEAQYQANAQIYQNDLSAAQLESQQNQSYATSMQQYQTLVQQLQQMGVITISSNGSVTVNTYRNTAPSSSVAAAPSSSGEHDDGGD